MVNGAIISHHWSPADSASNAAGGFTISRLGERPRVLVVGAGLAGTATAIRLLRFARQPLEVVVIERRADYRCAGVAYHRDGNPWEHVFNIQAGRMSVFREDVNDFLRWANAEADRRNWPAPWATIDFVEQGPAPRRIYHDYLVSRLAEAAREAYPGVELVETDGEVVDLRVCPGRVEVSIRERARIGRDGLSEATARVIAAQHVVLATGPELKNLPFATDVLGHESFVRNPYSAAGLQKLLTVPSEATVAIVGSVLSAYDSAALLLRHGHQGCIYLISRTGAKLRTYPDGHRHAVVSLACPALLLGKYESRDEFIARVRSEWEAAWSVVTQKYPDVDRSVVAERIVKAWEPHLPAIVERIPSGELRRLLDEFGTVIAAFRVGAVAYTTAVVEQAMAPAGGSVKLIAGAVVRIRPALSGRLAVSVAGPSATCVIPADLVVSNFGREPDYSRVDSTLWQNLLRRGLVIPHERTGRGLEVDERGVVLGAGGRWSGPISVVGALREGDEIVRNGRTGAFSFNLAAIKNHSIAVAAHVVERLEWNADQVAVEGHPGRGFDEARRLLLDEAVVLEVRRMATAARGERERIDRLLDRCLQSLREPATADRLVRLDVMRAAVRRLTDVTVTPWQLRQRLGLAVAGESGPS